MFTGLAFLIATKAKDFMTVIAWGFTIIIVFALPAMGIMIPGMASGWIKVIPSYFIVDTLDKVTCAGGGWSDISSNLLALLVSNVIILSLGIIALKRKIS